MILTGVTKSMVEKAVRNEPLLSGRHYTHIPPVAVEIVCKALHEHSCAEWDLSLDEQKAWDDLPIGAKEIALQNATWLIGRLALEGYVIVYKGPPR